jgi:hypothetical protein
MTNLKKDILKRNAHDISNKIKAVMSKYKISETCKDELLQIADSAICLKHKINDI